MTAVTPTLASTATRSRAIVHLVGRITDEVLAFLGPTMEALAQSGLPQTVVLIDDPRHRHLLARLPASAHLVLVAHLRNPILQWRAMAHACHAVLSGGTPLAVHFHGFVPRLLGIGALDAANLQVPTYYSPHGSRSLGTWRLVGMLVQALLRPLWSSNGTVAIVNVAREIPPFERWTAVTLVESPVADAFLKVVRKEASHPLIVSGGRALGSKAAERFAQLAVLLSSDELHIAFNWFGRIDAGSRVLLKAANVGMFEAADAEQRATRLAAGWVWVAPGDTRGFPLPLAEAMAAGLACVAMDTPQHRDVIRDGETGFLCHSEHDLVQRIATLVDSPALRARVGAAARLEAARRFGASGFSDSILEAYGEHAEASNLGQWIDGQPDTPASAANGSQRRR